MSLALSQTAGKRLELLREVVPGLKRVAIFGNSGNPLVATERNAAVAAAHVLGLDTIVSGVQTEEDIAPTIKSLKGNADALYVCEDPFTVAEAGDDQRGSACSATSHNAAFSDQVLSKAAWSPTDLMFSICARRAIELVDKILRGTKPADIPFEQPTKFDLAINLKTAKALGLTISEIILTRADFVIE